MILAVLVELRPFLTETPKHLWKVRDWKGCEWSSPQRGLGSTKGCYTKPLSSCEGLLLVPRREPSEGIASCSEQTSPWFPYHFMALGAAWCFVRKVFWKKAFLWSFEKLLSLTSGMFSNFQSLRVWFKRQTKTQWRLQTKQFSLTEKVPSKWFFLVFNNGFSQQPGGKNSFKTFHASSVHQNPLACTCGEC